jgi:sulfatase modifying factor 1
MTASVETIMSEDQVERDLRRSRRADMIRISGGSFWMGSDAHYPEEAPAHQVHIDGFWIDATPVTNADFADFVEATGHVTLAETPPDPADYPGMKPDMARAGSLCFHKPSGRVPLDDFSHWWSFCFGADWRHPAGPGSGIAERGDHPVVHVAYSDAEAYAHWAGKSLPTEAEWECAARGGLVGKAFAWGDELAPKGRMLANYWQGEFPWQNFAYDGFEGTSPVRSFPANGYGVFDMIGNVWEWTDDWFAPRRAGAPECSCAPSGPRRAGERDSYDPCTPDIPIGRKVLKGGSHLCAPNYCQRYRPAARFPEPIDTSASHVGFRCVVRAGPLA